MTAGESVTRQNDGAVARLILRRPPLNILSMEMIQQLNRALGDLRTESGLRVLVLSAEGRAFSAGVAVEDHFPDRAEAMLRSFHEVFRRLRLLAVPLVTAVQGPALGGGCELACAGDWIIASEDASFGVPEIKLGSFPPVAAVLFPHRIGAGRALQMILSGDILPASEALRIGLVDHVVPAADLAAAVEETVERLREKSGPVLRLAKRAVYAAQGVSFENGLAEAERLFLDHLMKTTDATEGLRAFLEKRAPAWKQK